jgi:iron complex outermembrane receptor protein
LDFQWYATDQLRFSGTYGYLDTQANDLVLDGFNGPSDFSGLPLRQSPKNTYSFVANYNMPISSGELDFRLQFTHTDDQHFDFVTAEDTIADEVDLVDARISWNSTDEKYSVALWGQNITDEGYVTHSYRIGPGTIGVWGAPATYGVTGTVNF